MNSYNTFIGITIVVVLLGFIVLWITAPRSEEKGGNLKEDAKLESRAFPGKNLPQYKELYANFFTHIETAHKQNTNIYTLSRITMFVGFIIIGFGGLLYTGFSSFGYPDRSLEEAIANTPINPLPVIMAGVFTEFIAIIIIFIYRSVSRQTESHFKSLERLTTIGIAIQILDDLSDDPGVEAKAKGEAKAEIAKKILESNIDSVVRSDKVSQKNS